mmetsp:Transcript_52856/g.167830  ORF Transcript_52856/g.167830 Transcript_52856/m.167830 type:complete len:224 (-) Transcript_52856:302-973(-)
MDLSDSEPLHSTLVSHRSTRQSMLTQLVCPSSRWSFCIVSMSHTVTLGSRPHAHTWLVPMGTSTEMRSASETLRRHWRPPARPHSRMVPSSDPLHTPLPATTRERTLPSCPSRTCRHRPPSTPGRVVSHTRMVWSSAPDHSWLPICRRHRTPLVWPLYAESFRKPLADHATIRKSIEPVHTTAPPASAVMHGTPPTCHVNTLDRWNVEALKTMTGPTSCPTHT